MLHSRYGVLWMHTQHSFSSKHDKLSFYQKVIFWFHLTIWHSPILFWIIQMLSSKLQTGLDMYCLSRGTRLALQDLSPWRRSVLLMVAFVTLVPALCRSFTSPPVWFWDFCSQFLWSFWPTGWDLAWSPRSREIISGLVCLPFSNNCSHSWFLHTKLLTYCRFSLPSLVQVYNFVSVSFDSSLVLAIVEFGVWLFEVVDRCLLKLITSSNRCH